MGASRTNRAGSTATLEILIAIFIVLYIVAVTLIAVWWTKEERKFANKSIARIERQLETCKRNNNE